jgi:Mrp family chromosome partitioning ATPase
MDISMETTNAVYCMRDMQRASGARLFSIVGAHQGDGATFSCVNLGLAAASLLDDVSVVMIDGDHAGPGLSAAAEVTGDGWTDWLASGRKGSLLDLVRPWPNTDSLSLLPVGSAGPANGGPAPQWREIIDALVQKHQLVLADCPPFFSGGHGRAICREGDGVFVVIAAEKTRRPVATAMLNELRASNCNVIGAILNRRRFHIPERIYRQLF